MKIELTPEEAQGWLDLARMGASQMARIAVAANENPAVPMDRYAAMAHKLAAAVEVEEAAKNESAPTDDDLEAQP